jgi:hypothetical protein
MAMGRRMAAEIRGCRGGSELDTAVDVDVGCHISKPLLVVTPDPRARARSESNHRGTGWLIRPNALPCLCLGLNFSLGARSCQSDGQSIASAAACRDRAKDPKFGPRAGEKKAPISCLAAAHQLPCCYCHLAPNGQRPSDRPSSHCQQLLVAM